jgi:hypothetical protein
MSRTASPPRQEFNGSASQDRLEFMQPTARRSEGREIVSVEQFRRRADECRSFAAPARNASDKAFWLALVERWQALEIQKAQQSVLEKPQSPRRRQSVSA